VAARLVGVAGTIVDIGCGIGLMAAYLHESGFAQPVVGIDHDARKIEQARRAVPSATFEVADAREAIPDASAVLLLDVLHYFDDDDQSRILANAARADLVIIREALRDGTWRQHATKFAEKFARRVRWMREDKLNFPPRGRIETAFAGFSAEVTPMWGATPFNNYLFVFRRES
jgi:trans-aconitate methyltransferase